MGQTSSRQVPARELSEVSDRQSAQVELYQQEETKKKFKQGTVAEQRQTLAKMLKEVDSMEMADVFYDYLQEPFDFAKAYAGISIKESGLLPLCEKLYFYTRFQKALGLPFPREMLATLLADNQEMDVLDLFALLKELKPRHFHFVDYAGMRTLLSANEKSCPQNWTVISLGEVKPEQVILFKNVRSEHYALVYHAEPDATTLKAIRTTLEKQQAKLVLHLCADEVVQFANQIQASFKQHRVLCYRVDKSLVAALQNVTVVQEAADDVGKLVYINNYWSARLIYPEQLLYSTMPQSCYDLLDVIASHGPLLACLPLPNYIISLLQKIKLIGSLSSPDAKVGFSDTLKQAPAVFLHWFHDFLLSETEQDLLLKKVLLKEGFVNHATVYNYLKTTSDDAQLEDFLQCTKEDFLCYATQIKTLPAFQYQDFPLNVKKAVCHLTGARAEDFNDDPAEAGCAPTSSTAMMLGFHADDVCQLSTQDMTAYARVLMAKWGEARQFAARHGGEAQIDSYIANKTFKDHGKTWWVALLPSVEISGQGGNSEDQFIAADYYLDYNKQFGDGGSEYLYCLLKSHESLQTQFSAEIEALRKDFAGIAKIYEKDGTAYNQVCRQVMEKCHSLIEDILQLLQKNKFELGKHFDKDTLFNMVYNFVDQKDKGAFQAYIEKMSGHIQHDVFHELELAKFFTPGNRNIKLFLPFNLGDWHWVSMEIQLSKKDHLYTADVFYYDPMHGPEIVPEEHYKKVEKAILKRLAQCDAKAKPSVSKQKHSYKARQINNGTCCGVYALFDIATRAQGAPLQPYQKSAAQLRQQMIDDLRAMPAYPRQKEDIARLEQRLRLYEGRGHRVAQPPSTPVASTTTETEHEASPVAAERSSNGLVAKGRQDATGIAGNNIEFRRCGGRKRF